MNSYIPYVSLTDSVGEVEIRHQDAGGSQHAASHNEHHHEWLRRLDQTGVTLDDEDRERNESPREETQQR